jgi:hypothetical protein
VQDEWEELVNDAERLAKDHPATQNPLTSLPQTVLGMHLPHAAPSFTRDTDSGMDICLQTPSDFWEHYVVYMYVPRFLALGGLHRLLVMVTGFHILANFTDATDTQQRP